MGVDLGPVSTESARAWISYATDMLAVLRALPKDQRPAHALDGFASLLNELRPIARSGMPFRWSSDEQPERVQYLLNALYVAGTIERVEIHDDHGPTCLLPVRMTDPMILRTEGRLLALLAGEAQDTRKDR